VSTEARTEPRRRIYDPGDIYDEALTPDGFPRPEYREVLEAIAKDPGGAREATDAALAELGASFGSGEDAEPFVCDPVPRILTTADWETLADGLAQRAQALNEFVADVYSRGRIVRDGVLPAAVVAQAEHFEPGMTGLSPEHPPATVVGFDLVRGADGSFRVLEDNLRTPSGLAYAGAARIACDSWLGARTATLRRPLDPGFEALREALREAAPAGAHDPRIVLLTEGPSNVAWYEHRQLAALLEVPAIHPRQLRRRAGRLWADLGEGGAQPVDVIYRRTDQDRLVDERGRPTWLSDLLLEPLRRGVVSVVNRPGTGVADDKLAHAYVDEMVRYYLGEEPRIESVPTFGLTTREARDRARGRQDQLVIKPRAAYGGKGVSIGSEADESERLRMALRMEESPDGLVAQEIVTLSRHPTVHGDRLEPRPVDLRAFAIVSASRTEVAPGGLTRFARDPDSLMVSSTQGGGGKDTWVLG
jgi:uncharacterized circularly permuted ATP-grasp superfamily protein